MKDNRDTIVKVVAAGAFLFLLSLYRQYHRLGGDPETEYVWVVHAGYMLLLGYWGISIHRRISQRNLRLYILEEITVMAFWMTIRALQESVLVDNLAMVRASGYFIAVPLMLLPLLGFYSVLGLDKGPEYRIDRRWYWLFVPAVLLILLMLSNESHHLVFLKEEEINLQFRWNWGIFLIVLWSIILVGARLVLLIRKSQHNRDYPYMRYMPLLIGMLTLGMFAAYLMHSFNVRTEVIELTAKHYFMEMLLWESCIGVGMVPVNCQYEQVFGESTEAMQIMDDSGKRIAASVYAPEISRSQFEQLKAEHHIPAGEGLELRLHAFPGGYLIWQQDLSGILALLGQMQQTAEELEQEGILLKKELAARSEESRLQAKNAIYDSLSSEVDGELKMLDELLDEEIIDIRQWQIIGLLGTYVKRLCNLRLIYEESGTLEQGDLKITVGNLMEWVRRLCSGADLLFQPQPEMDVELCFLSLKVPLCLLERADFAPERFFVSVGQSLEVTIGTCGEYPVPTEQIEQMLGDDYTAMWTSVQGDMKLTIRREMADNGL